MKGNNQPKFFILLLFTNINQVLSIDKERLNKKEVAIMTKGTTSLGKRTKKTHIMCRRCGKHSYHIRKKTCASCGFGSTSRKRHFNWVKKEH
jgi:large subunit ribosomal protein L37e